MNNLKTVEDLSEELERYKRYVIYMSALQGMGLDIIGWHDNGEVEPLDNFLQSALECMEEKGEIRYAGRG